MHTVSGVKSGTLCKFETQYPESVNYLHNKDVLAELCSLLCGQLHIEKNR